MLEKLGAGFMSDPSWALQAEAVRPDSIPPVPRSLLVHDRHMTATLNAHHGQSVSLEVLSFVCEGNSYRRKIALHIDDGRIVEFGLVRLRLDLLPDAARGDIEARVLPLGEIFLRYGVMTRVAPQWFLRFAPGNEVVRCLGNDVRAEAYGRLGLIHCNGQPAVELLEVVPG